MNLINVCLMIFLTTLTGSMAFGLWKLGSSVLEKQGKIYGIRGGLILVFVFYLFPVLFFFLAYQAGTFSDCDTGPLGWRTPFLLLASRLLAAVWTVGFLWRLARYKSEKKELRVLLKSSRAAEREIQEQADFVGKCVGLYRRLPVYLSKEVPGPFIIGVFRSRIFLPEKSYGEYELRVILEHELRHYRQGDLLLKSLCIWISWLQWFNPLTKKLFEEVDTWGDIHCDLHLCYGAGSRGNWKQYFGAVIDNVPETGTGFHMGMGLRTSKEELEERIRKMKRHNPKKELGKAALVLLAVCFLLTLAGTALAAGKGVEALYGVVYAATEKMEYEEPGPEPVVSEETEWLPDESLTIVDTGDNLNARGGGNYAWTISANTLSRTGAFYAAKGSKVTISVNPDPAGAATGIGLDQPNGYLRGVSGTGSYSHTFTILESGNHKAYVRNESGSKITAYVTVVR